MVTDVSRPVRRILDALLRNMKQPTIGNGRLLGGVIGGAACFCCLLPFSSIVGLD